MGENGCQLSIDRGLVSRTPLWDDPRLRLSTLPGSCQQRPTEGLPSVNNKSSDSKSVIYVYSVQDHLDYWRTHLCLTMTLWCCYLFVCGKGVYMSVRGLCMCPCVCQWCTCRGYITLHIIFSETGSLIGLQLTICFEWLGSKLLGSCCFSPGVRSQAWTAIVAFWVGAQGPDLDPHAWIANT